MSFFNCQAYHFAGMGSDFRWCKFLSGVSLPLAKHGIPYNKSFWIDTDVFKLMRAFLTLAFTLWLSKFRKDWWNLLCVLCEASTASHRTLLGTLNTTWPVDMFTSCCIPWNSKEFFLEYCDQALFIQFVYNCSSTSEKDAFPRVH